MHIKREDAPLAAGRMHWLIAVVILVVGALLGPFIATPRSTHAAPFSLCSANGFLYQYPGPGVQTQVHSIDMVTAQDSVVATISDRQINAIGYNVKDNFVYGWDDNHDTFVRIHADHSADPLTISGYSGPTSGIIIGDVDDKGHYWFIAGSNWYQVDLTTSTPTQIASGSAAGISGSAGADWAYVPGTDSLYRIMDNGGADMRLWSFSRTTKTWTNHTPVTPLAGITNPSDFTMGAFYADPDGHLYASSNSPSGKLWRVDVTAAPYTATHIGTGTPSSSNDGARCAAAPVPTDFGDAPSSYDTLLSDNGPRHNVVSYNDGDNTAPLMLGKKIDLETDGLPNAAANGDDTTDIDDEQGVGHIVATPGTPTALSIPVTATNNDSTAATLAGWIDLDSDGTFENAERTTASIPANSGTGLYKLDFPTATFTDDSYARFRLFSGNVADPQPTGSSTGGEIEDVLVQTGTYSVTKTANPSDGSAVTPGETVTYTLTFRNTGSTDLTDLSFQDDLSGVLDDATFEGNITVSPSSAGTASRDGNTLEFTGDIPTGQSVRVSYAVKVKSAGSLKDNRLQNKVLAAQSNCHPSINGQTVTVTDDDCFTQHTVSVASLANTGSDILLPLALATGLLGASGAALYASKYVRHATANISRG